jgi:hypothetical protein
VEIAHHHGSLAGAARLPGDPVQQNRPAFGSEGDLCRIGYGSDAPHTQQPRLVTEDQICVSHDIRSKKLF